MRSPSVHADQGDDRRRPELRGRDRQRAIVAAALDAVGRGEGGVVVVEGPPGIGKSRFLAEARELAARAGVRVLAGEAHEGGQAVPFAPLLAALAGAGTSLQAPEPADSREPRPEGQFWMLHDLQDALETVALAAPVVIVLDDVQWADPGTLVALATLPHRLAGTPILWLVALRSGDPRPEVQDAMARLTADGARRLTLGPLTGDAVAAVLGDALGAELDPALLELAAGARGNPFMLAELLRGLREEDRVRVEHGRARLVGTELPRRLTDPMRARLDRLPGAARELVRAASVLASRFTADQLAAMLDRRPSALVGPLEEALRSELLAESGDLLRFRHDLLRRAVLDSLPAAERRRLQRRAVDVLLERGAAPVEVALQLADSADPGDREAVAKLREAARTLAGADAQAAAELSSRALELMPPDDPERPDLVAETVVFLHWAMRPADARALGERTLAGDLPAAQAAAIRLSLSSLHMRSPTARAQDNLRALQLGALEPHMRARHLAWLTYNLATTGLVEQVPAAAASALEAADATGDRQARVVTTLGLVCADGVEGRCARALERLEAIDPLLRTAEPEPYLLVVGFHRANVLAELGRIADAMDVLQAESARGRRERNAWLVRTCAQYGSLLRLEAGRLADARAEAESCETSVAEIAAGYLAGVRSLLTLAQVAIHTGDRRQLERSVDDAERVHRTGGLLVRRAANWILALAALAREDPVGAARRLRDEAEPHGAPVFPGLTGRQPSMVRIGLAAGDLELARLAAEGAERLDRLSPGVPLLAATAAHARGLLEDDAELLVEAARRMGATELPLQAAAACEDAAGALARAGHARDAADLLTDALTAYVTWEATADARRAGRALRRLGMRRRPAATDRPSSGWASLTESELRVARLIGAGARNREAAERLCLSPHTVSSHLRSAFAKLGITSRAELARIARDHGDGAAAAPPPRS